MEKIRPVNDATSVKTFDHTTPQDMKRHSDVQEEYYCNDGSMTIMWHKHGEDPNIVELQTGESIIFDPMTCIWVMPSHDFEATATKTRESTYKNGKKQAGESCTSYTTCILGKLCSNLKSDRNTALVNKENENS